MLFINRLRVLMLGSGRPVARLWSLGLARPWISFSRLWRASRTPWTRVRWAGVWACPVTWVVFEVYCIVEIGFYSILCRYWCQEAICAACDGMKWARLLLIVRVILALSGWLLWWKEVVLRLGGGHHHLDRVFQWSIKWLITYIIRLFINVRLKGAVLFQIWLALLF